MGKGRRKPQNFVLVPDNIVEENQKKRESLSKPENIHKTRNGPDQIVQEAKTMWDASHEPLLHIAVHGKNSKSGTKSKVKDCLLPKKIESISLQQFLELIPVKEEMDKLKNLTYPNPELKEKSPLYLHHTLRTALITGYMETGIEEVVKDDIKLLSSFYLRNSYSDQLPIHVNAADVQGKPDVSFGNPDANLLFGVIEIKPITYNPEGQSMVEIWNEVEQYEKDGQVTSPIAQTFDYMCINGKFYGMLATHYNFWIFIRDCYGNLVIVEPFPYNLEDGPCTAAQYLTLFIRLSMKNSFPYADDWILEPCQTGAACKHVLGIDTYNPHTINDTSAPFVLNGTNGGVKVGHKKGKKKTKGKPPTSQHNRTMQEEYAVRLKRPEQTLVLVKPGRYVSLGKAVLDTEENNVIKWVDMLKDEQGEEELKHEKEMYDELCMLQGKWIPKFIKLDNNYLSPRLLSLYTSCEGKPLSEVEIPDEEIEKIKEQCVEALQAIHNADVIHGDVILENIVVSESFEVKVIDFGASAKCTDNQLKEKEMETLKGLIKNL